MKSRKGVLVLENGNFFAGNIFGYPRITLGEVCFNTSMTGYQEILTDPSYAGQIVTMTYPMIGNYGINEKYSQSEKIQCEGLIIKKLIRRPSNFESHKSLEEFLIENYVMGLEGIDTRRLVLTLRDQGVMRGGIFPDYDRFESFMMDEILKIPVMNGRDLASEVSIKAPYVYSKEQKKLKIAVYDFGVKRNILKYLDEAGFEVFVFPASTPAEELEDFHAYFLSNGPGDPAALTYAIENVKKLLSFNKPLFGICLGHQILGLARGWKTYKLKFGHRGGNQPVIDRITGKVEITAQNHGFVVAPENKENLEIIYINLNDNTIEGFRDRVSPVLSVQHHPEASPGPHDSLHIFNDFFHMVKKFYENN